MQYLFHINFQVRFSVNLQTIISWKGLLHVPNMLQVLQKCYVVALANNFLLWQHAVVSYFRQELIEPSAREVECQQFFFISDAAGSSLARC